MFKLVMLLAVVGAAYAFRLTSPGCNNRMMCLEIDDPVCGTDGNTYPNSCYMYSRTCGRVTTAHQGACTTSVSCDEFMACTDDYNPVCGTDGVTYSNACSFRSQTCGTDVTVAHDGECSPNRAPCDEFVFCTDDYRPVCGTDGITYSNECSMSSRTCGSDVTVAHDGECSPNAVACNEFMACTYDYRPVCGTDGITYPNACSFRSHTCGSDVTIAHDGECSPSPAPCDEIVFCTADYRPVCGTDGTTYPNECSMGSQTCGKGVTKAHDGVC